MTAATWKVLADMDLDLDGAYEEDISAYVEGFSFGGGRESALDKFDANILELTLDNDGRFSPKNTAGAYSPNFKRWRGIRFRTQVTLPAVTNLVDNPSVENDLMGWTSPDPDWAVARVTTEGRFGKAAVEVTTTGAAGNADTPGVLLTQRDGNRFPVTAALDFAKSLWIKIPGAAGQSATLYLYFWDAASGGSRTSFALQAITFTGDWQRVEVAATADGSATHADIRIAGGNVGTFHIDGAQFEQAAAATVYCDGDQPGATWAGTAHESTSSRGANPTFNAFTGQITNIEAWRDEDKKGHATIQAVGKMARFPSVKVYQGIINASNATDSWEWQAVINRALDLLETPELCSNPGCEVDTTNWGTVGSSGLFRDKVGAFGGAGSYVPKYTLTGTAERGGKYTATGDLAVSKKYKISALLRTDRAGTFRMRDDVLGVIDSVAVAVDPGGNNRRPVWYEVSGTFDATSTVREIEFVTSDASAGGQMFVDEPHFCLFSQRIDRSIVSAGLGVPHNVTAFSRSGRAFLEDMVDSAGGWLYEDRAGLLTFEDINERSVTPIPKVRLSDSPNAGISPAPGMRFREAEQLSFTDVEVFSNGRSSAADPGVQVLWSLEPVPLTLGNNESRKLWVRYMGLEGITRLLGMAGASDDILLNVTYGAGGATETFEDFGEGARITIVAGGAGATIDSMNVTGVVRQFPSHRTRRTYTPAGAGDEPVQATLPIEMPFNRETSALDTVAQILGDRYFLGASLLSPIFDALTDEEVLAALGFDIGTPILVRHKLGQGILGVEATYYIEGYRVEGSVDEAGWRLAAEWNLETAA